MMKRTVTLAAATFAAVLGSAALSRSASAQEGAGGARGVGVGVQEMLRGGRGLSVAYDGGPFHIDGHLGASDFGGARGTNFTIGARGWFHLHQTGASDFSIGGGLGFVNNQAGDQDVLSIEAGMLLRVFLVSNVAVGAFGGIAVVPHDDRNDGFVLNGQLLGGLSLHYFFR
jgi:hypothetical protein